MKNLNYFVLSIIFCAFFISSSFTAETHFESKVNDNRNTSEPSNKASNSDKQKRNTRKCQIVKRAKNKKELYTIVIEVPNTNSFDNAHAVVIFDKEQGKPQPKNQKIVLHSFTKPKKNAPTIALESEAFEIQGSTTNETLNFTVLLYNNKNKVVEKVRGQVSFGETAQKEEIIEASLVIED